MHRAVPADCLQDDRLFSQLEEAVRGRLLAIGVRRKLNAGQRVVLRDQVHTGLYCVVQGTARVMNPPCAGQESFLLSIDAPAWFGELGLFDGAQHSHEICAHTDCQVLFFPRDELLSLLEAEPGLWIWLGRMLGAKLRLAFFVLDELSRMTTEMKLARHVLMKAAGFGALPRADVSIRIRQEHLADSLGLARASITPVLRDWRKRTIVQVRYGCITLLDVEELKSIAGFSAWPQYYRDRLAGLL